MADKMSLKMLGAVPAIHMLMLNGKKCHTACAEVGINGQSSRTTIKKYMKYHGYIDEHGKAVPAKKGKQHNGSTAKQSQLSVEQFSKLAKSKQQEVHDEFDAEIFRQRIESFSRPDNAYDGDKQIFVFTSALNDAKVDERFLQTLEFYCKTRNAELFIAPLRYSNPTSALSFAASKNMTWDPRIKPYACKTEVDFGMFAFCGNLNINATSPNPTGGFQEMSRGKTLIIPHPRMHMEPLASLDSDPKPAVVHSTGCVTQPCYSDSKAGYRASFNHDLSAVVVELDGDVFHFTQIEYDGNGFYDRGDYWEPNQISHFVDSCTGLFMGDIHARFIDPNVKRAVFDGPNSVCAKLKPVAGVFSDLLDFNSATHHDAGQHYNKYAKHHADMDDVQQECDEALRLVVNSPFREKLIQAANHNDALHKWCQSDIGGDYQNRKFYHLMNYLIFDSARYGDAGAECDNALEIYARLSLSEEELNGVKFLNRSDSHMISGINVSCHGDIGTNGSRGSRRQYAMLDQESAIGHSHSPGILGNCWQAGTFSRLRMGYNKGPSSWMHSMIAIYNNGKRQMLNVVDGRWRKA